MPGSMGELKPLVLIVSFLGLLFILINMIPGEFYAASYEGREVNIPEYFEGIDIQSYIQTWTYTLNETEGKEVYGYYDVNINDGDFAGHKFRLSYKLPNSSSLNLLIDRCFTTWFFFEDAEHMIWYNKQGIKLTDCLLTDEQIEGESVDGESRYVLRCSKAEFDVYFYYNSTIWNNATEAWNHHELHFFAGIGFDQLNTSINAWSLISSILFFQMPDVHPILNAMVAIPLWISIAYLVYVLILKAIPFVGG